MEGVFGWNIIGKDKKVIKKEKVKITKGGDEKRDSLLNVIKKNKKE